MSCGVVKKMDLLTSLSERFGEILSPTLKIFPPGSDFWPLNPGLLLVRGGGSRVIPTSQLLLGPAVTAMPTFWLSPPQLPPRPSGPVVNYSTINALLINSMSSSLCGTTNSFDRINSCAPVMTVAASSLFLHPPRLVPVSCAAAQELDLSGVSSQPPT